MGSFNLLTTMSVTPNMPFTHKTAPVSASISLHFLFSRRHIVSFIISLRVPCPPFYFLFYIDYITRVVSLGPETKKPKQGFIYFQYVAKKKIYILVRIVIFLKIHFKKANKLRGAHCGLAHVFFP